MRRKLLLGCLIIFVACALSAGALGGAGLFLYTARSQPEEKNQALFEGISYIRDTRQTPRRMVVHVVKVNLRAEGVRFLVTPGERLNKNSARLNKNSGPNKNSAQERSLRARTTAQFVADFGVQLAVNGDGVTPSHYNNPLDYYPHAGDRVEPLGFAASEGQVYSENPDNAPVLYISRRNRARFNSPLGGVYNAISGFNMVLQDGQPAAGLDRQVHPRTVLALDEARRTLIIVVVDGRQPGYSQGASLAEMAEIVKEHGGYDAMNMDGGGSSALVMQGADGRPLVLNSPIHRNIPGEERPVGNHLGIYAQPPP